MQLKVGYSVSNKETVWSWGKKNGTMAILISFIVLSFSSFSLCPVCASI